jgi:hypothetical protein
MPRDVGFEGYRSAWMTCMGNAMGEGPRGIAQAISTQEHSNQCRVPGKNHDNQAAPGSAAISFTNPARSECSPSS